MSSAKLKTAFAAVVVISLTLPTLVQQRSIQQLRQGQAQLRAQLAQRNQERTGLLEQMDRLQGEIAGHQLAQTELLRLRGEVAQLRRNGMAASTGTKKVSSPASAAKPSTPEQKTFVVQDECTIPPRGTLVTGGWEIRPGIRALILISPIAHPQANEVSSVELTTQIFETSAEFLEAQSLRLSALGTGTESLVLDPLTARQLRDRLESAAGATLRSAPRVMSLSGREAMIMVNTGDPDHDSQISFVPTYNPSDGSIHLTSVAQIGAPPTPTDGPAPIPAPVRPK